MKNKTCAKNIASLESFIMYLFKEDTTAIPEEIGWFLEVNSTELMLLMNRTLTVRGVKIRLDWSKIPRQGRLKV